ncbi:MAG: hypothetical protein ACRDD5_22195 [Silvania sp.]
MKRKKASSSSVKMMFNEMGNVVASSVVNAALAAVQLAQGKPPSMGNR